MSVRRLFGLAAMIISMSAIAFPCAAEPDQAGSAARDARERAAVSGFFSGSWKVAPGLFFTKEFLQAVPQAQLAAIVDQLAVAYGSFSEATGGSGSWTARLEKANVDVAIALDATGLVAGLRLLGVKPVVDDLAGVLAELRKAAPRVSVCLTRDGVLLPASLEPDQPLAVGSAFKLSVLAALDRAVAEGRERDETVVSLSAAHLSLPSGLLQDWPAGSPLTLRSAASLMISLSDNTAADLLVARLGRQAVEAEAPARVRPLLTTAEFFKLKFGADAAPLEAWKAGGEAERRALLSRLATAPLPRATAVGPEPRAIAEAEWLYSTRELCSLAYRLREDPSLRINPGLARKADFRFVGYKGGSEPGVHNETYVLAPKGSKSVYAVSVTANDPEKPLDEKSLMSAIVRLLSLVADFKD